VIKLSYPNRKISLTKSSTGIVFTSYVTRPGGVNQMREERRL